MPSPRRGNTRGYPCAPRLSCRRPGFTTTPTTTTAASKVILRLFCRRPGFHHGAARIGQGLDPGPPGAPRSREIA